MPDVDRFLGQLVERAQRLGAPYVEALQTSSEGRIIEVSRGKVVRAEPTADARLTLRCIDDRGAEGQAAGSPEEAETLLEQALAAASAAPVRSPAARPASRLPAARLAPPRGLGIDDRRYPALTDEERREVLLDAEGDLKSNDRRVRVTALRYEDSRRQRIYANSRGTVAEEWGTTYRMLGAVTVAVGSQEVKIEECFEGRTFAGVTSLPLGGALASRAEAVAAPRASWSGPVRMLIPSRIVAWCCEQLARRAVPGHPTPDLHPSLHLIDDGTLAGGLRTSAFDDRGVPPRPVLLLREGRWYGTLSGSGDDGEATGHWFDGEWRPNNLVLRPGMRSVAVVVAEQRAPVFVLDSVDASFDAESGRWTGTASGVLTRGGVEGALRESRFEANLYEVLTRVVEVTGDTDRIGGVDAPAILVDGASLTA